MCNGRQAQNLTCINYSLTADNGLRRPSKPTGIRVVPEYRKIRNGPFYCLFRRKEVRCFSTKRRRKNNSFPTFWGFFAVFHTRSAVALSPNDGRKCFGVGRNGCKKAEIHAGKVAKPCQNNSRCLYFLTLQRQLFLLCKRGVCNRSGTWCSAHPACIRHCMSAPSTPHCTHLPSKPRKRKPGFHREGRFHGETPT